MSVNINIRSLTYTYDGSEVDEYGDTWYYYSKGDVCVDMVYYYYSFEMEYKKCI